VPVATLWMVSNLGLLVDSVPQVKSGELFRSQPFIENIY
jgi:hypothetical protein